MQFVLPHNFVCKVVFRDGKNIRSTTREVLLDQDGR